MSFAAGVIVGVCATLGAAAVAAVYAMAQDRDN